MKNIFVSYPLDGSPCRLSSDFITADVRLDYRADLIRKLSHDGALLDLASDTELIAASYKEWGAVCVKHLEGDYAFLLWDATRHCLFGARSSTGLRALVYHRSRHTITFASEAKQLLVCPEVSTALNAHWISYFLVTGFNAHDMTPYTSLKKLPAGHSIMIESAGRVTIRTFQPGAKSPLHFRSQQDSTDHFRSLLFAAVQSRLTGSGHALVDISGGLDSSSLACIAGKFQASETGDISVSGVHGYSASFPENDDRSLAHQVGLLAGIPLATISYDHCLPFTGIADPRPWSDTPSPPTLFFRRYYEKLWSIASEQGAMFHLRGDFGDQLFDASPRYLQDLAREYRYFKLLSEAWSWQQHGEVSVAQILSYSIWLPCWQHVHGRASKEQACAPWLRASVIEDAAAYQEEQRAMVRHLLVDPLARQFYAATLWHDTYVSMQHDGIRAAGLQTLEPFTDGRLMAFLLACPAHYQMRFGVKKFLLREAMQGLLPEPIRTRRSKGRIARLLFQGIAQQRQVLQDLVLHMPAALEPYIDAKQLSHAVDQAAQGGAIDQIPFLNALALVIWSHTLPFLKHTTIVTCP